MLVVLVASLVVLPAFASAARPPVTPGPPSGRPPEIPWAKRPPWFPHAPGPVVFIARTGMVGGLDPGAEQPVYDRLVANGWTVTLSPWSAGCQPWPTTTLVIASSQTDPNVLACLNSHAKPVLALRSWLLLGQIANGPPQGSNIRDPSITDNTHYITQPFPTGPRTACSVTGLPGVVTDRWLNPLGTSLMSDVTGSALIVRDTGVPAKRAFVGWAGYNIFCDVTPDGWTLFDRTLDWLTA